MRKSFYLIILFLIFIDACTYNTMENTKRINSIKKLQNIQAATNIKKVLYDPRENTVIILPFNSNEIFIYKQGVFFNKIGGSGFDNNNFKKVTDICLSNDQAFFVLDSFDKVIKKFDLGGTYKGSISVKILSDPSLIELDNNGNFYIYDKQRKDLNILDRIDYRIIVNFAKFQFENPEYLLISGNKLVVYEKTKTCFFDLTGRLDRENQSIIHFDSGLNLIDVSNQQLKTLSQTIDFENSLNPNSIIYIRNSIIYQIYQNQVNLYELIY